MYAIRSYYDIDGGQVSIRAEVKHESENVITSYSIHYTKLYEALADAQARGYAEADPTFDVGGVDAAHKLTILSALAYGIPMQFSHCYTEGIARLTRADIAYAA